jgi:hypothetical protein
MKYLEHYNPYGIERSHDLMHHHMHFSMSDSVFSISNLVFYLFHSWIDVQFEMKTRMCNNVREANMLHNQLTLLKRRAQRFDPILNPKQESKALGSYPIMEWSDPAFSMFVAGKGNFDNQIRLCEEYGIGEKSIVYYFEALGYMLRSKDEMRTSKQMKEFYDEHYIKQNIETYAEFEGFGSYDAGYDFEIF